MWKASREVYPSRSPTPISEAQLDTADVSLADFPENSNAAEKNFRASLEPEVDSYLDLGLPPSV